MLLDSLIVNTSLIISPKQLADLLQNSASTPILVDVSKAAVYQQVHLPNAHFVDYSRLQHKGPIAGFAPEQADIQNLLEELGITKESYVVAYDDEGGTRASRFLWVLALAGHQNYSYLDGGIHAWLAAELPHSTEDSAPAVRSSFPIEQLHNEYSITFDELKSKLQQPNVVVWDTRSAEEYLGITVRANHAGHIPGAVNYNWERAIDRSNNNLLRPLASIKNELANLGISADKEVIVHCQTHHRSSFAWLLASHLGFSKVRGYAGSWQEWGNRDDAPVEQATEQQLADYHAAQARLAADSDDFDLVLA